MSMQLMKYLAMGRKIESDGIKFYSNAIKLARDLNSARLLEFLIEEEKVHLKAFDSLIADSRKSSHSLPAMRHKSLIFDRKAYKSVKGKAEVMDIFSTALQMEQNSISLYKKMAAGTTDKAIKAFLVKLADNEQMHYDLIMTHKDSMHNFMYWEGMEQPRIES